MVSLRRHIDSFLGLLSQRGTLELLEDSQSRSEVLIVTEPELKLTNLVTCQYLLRFSIALTYSRM